MTHVSRFSVWILAAASIGTAGRAAAQCTVNVPHVNGTWRTLPYQTPINPISATLLRTGKVLLVAGSENDAYNNSSGAQSYRTVVWDPAGTDQTSMVAKQVAYDVFCSGTAQLPHGRTITIGGSSDYSFAGESRASFFDPETEKFVQSQSMATGRWYGTATALGDGRVLAFSGLNSGGGSATTVQIYDLANAGAGWGSSISHPGFSPPLFPRSFLLPNGKVFFTAHGAGGSIATAWLFNPATSAWTSSIGKTRDRSYGTGVLLPLTGPSWVPKVMMFGGGDPATATTEVVDLSAGSPAWSPRASMSTGRIQLNAILLPNGKVVLSGGSVSNETPDTAGKTADLYDPVTNVMGNAGTASFSRLYHSVALLLPDATVASLGSNPGVRGRYVTAIEIYTPPYLYDSSDRLITTDRPVITGVPSGPVGYGSGFSVSYTSASPIASAVLVRPGSATHAFDMEQRFVGLCGASPQPACTGAGTLSLTAPPNGNIAPPGYYMLFLLDSAGVPSKAGWVDLETLTAPPPSGSISSPASDVTINAGSTVSFDSATTSTKYSWIFPGGSPSTSTAKTPGNVTFSSPGEYVASLTLIDAANNSDPSPPSRKIKVLPAGTDFDITISPASRTINPGQSSTYTVTVTPIHGFSGTINLTVDSESGFPSGVASGGFSPSTLPGSGSTTLTMNASGSAVPYATSLSVHGTSGALTHVASSTLVVNLAAPTNLAASTDDSVVELTWAASPGATGYRIGRSLGGAFTTIGCTSGLAYSDWGLTNGTTYHYAVTATNTAGADGGGASSESTEILATPPCPLPTYLGSLDASKNESGEAVWAWTSGGATTFDLVRGDLDVLRATSGDFGAALDALPGAEDACLLNDTSSLSFNDPYGDPAPGSGIFTILRPVTTSCPAQGTLDDGGALVGSRDAEVAASPRACP
jgi:hypothetical protein